MSELNIVLPDPLNLDLASVRRVATREEYKVVLGDLVNNSHLLELGLDLYHHGDTNTHWVGTWNASIHDHDRWYFATAVERGKGAMRGQRIRRWWSVQSDHEMSDSAFTGRKRLSRLPWSTPQRQVQELWSRMGNMNQSAHIMGDVQRSPRLLLSYTRLLNLDVYDIVRADLPGNVDGLDVLHELLYHYPTWQTANDAQGLPRGYALRMHGFQWVLERWPELHDTVGAFND